MKISIIIVTRNRMEDVRDTIHGFMKQTYQNKEIIVIDNESTDGTRDMMQKEFPEITYLWLPDNFDIKSINIGVEMADGDIIWRTDSDSYPEKPDTFDKIIEIFTNHDDIHIISSEDIEVRKNNMVWEWYPIKVDKDNIPEKGYKAHAFPGTGAAIRKEVFNKIGGFWEFGFEEIDFCTRAIVAGFNVRYFPNIRTLHFASPRDRDNPNRFVKISSQYIRYTWRYFPFWRALGRTFLFMNFQILLGFVSRIPVGAIIETVLSMNKVMIATARNERNIVPASKIDDITMGISLFSTQMKYVRELFKKKFGKYNKSGEGK